MLFRFALWVLVITLFWLVECGFVIWFFEVIVENCWFIILVVKGVKFEIVVFIVSGIDDCSCFIVCEIILVVMGIRIVGRIVATFFVGVGKMVGSFLMFVVLEIVVGVIFDGLGGVGRIVGRGFGLICVVTIGVDRLGVICVGDGLGYIVVKVEDGLVFFLEVSWDWEIVGEVNGVFEK